MKSPYCETQRYPLEWQSMKTANLAVKLPAELTEWVRITAAKLRKRPREIVAEAIRDYKIKLKEHRGDG